MALSLSPLARSIIREIVDAAGQVTYLELVCRLRDPDVYRVCDALEAAGLVVSPVTIAAYRAPGHESKIGERPCVRLSDIGQAIVRSHLRDLACELLVAGSHSQKIWCALQEPERPLPVALDDKDDAPCAPNSSN